MSSSLPLQREPQAVGTLITRDGKVLKSTSSHFIQETLGMFLYLFVFCVHALPYLFVFIYLFLAARGLCCCVQPCSGCGQWELLFYLFIFSFSGSLLLCAALLWLWTVGTAR